jgi:hypothetical protein
MRVSDIFVNPCNMFACIVAHFGCAGFGFNGDIISSVAYF